MPELDGIEATRRITVESPSVGVVVLTMSEDDGTVFAAVRAGARGYLLKGADQEEVVRAITTVAAGGAVFGAALARRIAEFFAAGPAGPATAFPQLTAREREVLDLVAAGPLERADRGHAVPVAEDGPQQRLERAGQAAGHRPGARRSCGRGKRAWAAEPGGARRRTVEGMTHVRGEQADRQQDRRGVARAAVARGVRGAPSGRHRARRGPVSTSTPRPSASTSAARAAPSCSGRRPSSTRTAAGPRSTRPRPRTTSSSARTAATGWSAPRCCAAPATATWGTCSTTPRRRRPATATASTRCRIRLQPAE